VQRTAALWTGVAFFFVLFSYYLLRPVRDAITPSFKDPWSQWWLFALTLVLTMLVNVPYMALASRMPSRRFVPLALHGFAASFVALAVAFHGTPAKLGVLEWNSTRGLLCAFFFSWLTAFAVCGVTLVWVHAVEHFRTGLGKRLFSLIAMGGTLGAVAGSETTSWLSKLPSGDAGWLTHDFHSLCMLLGAGGIEVALLAYIASLRACRRMHSEAGVTPAFTRTDLTEGLRLVLRDPYLRGIAAFVLISAMVATTFYFKQTELLRQQLPDDQRAHFLARVNAWQNWLALGCQLFLTGRGMLRLGLAPLLCVMPLLSGVSLAALAAQPALWLYGIIEVARRTAQFAFDKPAREVLFTALPLAQKYKAKAFIDTATLRTGDLLAASLLLPASLSATALALVVTPIALAWATLGIWLGRQCRRREAVAVAPVAAAVT
jgi:AAA family ATP:ADP antiporter